MSGRKRKAAAVEEEPEPEPARKRFGRRRSPERATQATAAAASQAADEDAGGATQFEMTQTQTQAGDLDAEAARARLKDRDVPKTANKIINDIARCLVMQAGAMSAPIKFADVISTVKEDNPQLGGKSFQLYAWACACDRVRALFGYNVVRVAPKTYVLVNAFHGLTETLLPDLANDVHFMVLAVILSHMTLNMNAKEEDVFLDEDQLIEAVLRFANPEFDAGYSRDDAAAHWGKESSALGQSKPKDIVTNLVRKMYLREETPSYAHAKKQFRFGPRLAPAMGCASNLDVHLRVLTEYLKPAIEPGAPCAQLDAMITVVEEMVAARDAAKAAAEAEAKKAGDGAGAVKMELDDAAAARPKRKGAAKRKKHDSDDSDDDE